MTPNISAMEAEIAAIQAQIDKATQRKNVASAVYADALFQRPVGIPATWLPDFTISAGTANIRAWFDPTFFGNSLSRKD